MPPESPILPIGESGEAEGTTVVDENADMSLLDDDTPAVAGARCAVGCNSLSLVPSSIARFGVGGTKALKFLHESDHFSMFRPEEKNDEFQVKIRGSESAPSRVPPRPLSFVVANEFNVALKCLTKLSICRFSLRYLPPEIGCLRKLGELDISFNKLKKLPSTVSGLTSLKLLKLANNKLVDLPPGFSNLSQLERLDLSNNRLTSLESLDFDLLQSLQYLNIQCNMVSNFCQIPSRIFKIEGDNEGKDSDISVIEVDVVEIASYSDNHAMLLDATSSDKNHSLKKMAKGGKHHTYSLQEIARQERLNYSRKFKGGHLQNKNTVMIMDGADSLHELSTAESDVTGAQLHKKQGISNCLLQSIPLFRIQSLNAGDLSNKVQVPTPENNLLGSSCKRANLKESDATSDSSTVTSDSTVLDKPRECDDEVDSHSCFDADKVTTRNKSSSLLKKNKTYFSMESGSMTKSKRHHDTDIDNPKPRKCRKPIDEHLNISFKYSSESFCSTEDRLPDGFYDAGRHRPFRPLEKYIDDSCLDSREVILLDRGRDEELDAIVLSAQILLSRSKAFSSSNGRNNVVTSDFQKVCMLALFVSDCFGGSDRSISIMRMRKAALGPSEQQPFICTCSVANNFEKNESFLQTCFSFADLCESSLRLIKDNRNSNVVPIGDLRFGVCRHRAVMMKYLCDRMHPPIPCELVRGYLDFMPHAWNTILVQHGMSMLRMVVDTCYPTDIREESDPEYFCRYIPLSRTLIPSVIKNPGLFQCTFPSILLSHLESGKASHHSVKRCKFGTLDAAAKIKNIDVSKVSEEIAKMFEYTFLGEVRMLCALRNHSCIVEIYGHQISSKWIIASDGREHRLLQSLIVMEYMKGGNLKSYLVELSKQGKIHVPADLAIHIARNIACALVEVHRKSIIHRDIKSENVLIDFDNKRNDGLPDVKLSDFDRAIPSQSYLHTCCIAHLGIHPPDICVGTPRWMAPEVLHAMNQRSIYGLEVDIWSYGCLLLELLTLQLPYEGLPDDEIFNLLQMKQRPKLTPEFEALTNKQGESDSFAGSCHSTDFKKLKFLVELYHQCTCSDPAERPSARQILEMFNSILPPSSSG